MEASRCIDIIDSIKPKIVGPKEDVAINRMRESARLLCDILETLPKPHVDHALRNVDLPSSFAIMRDGAKLSVRFITATQSLKAWTQVRDGLAEAIQDVSNGNFT